MPWCPRCDETFPEGPACPRCSARLVARDHQTHEDTLQTVPGLKSIKVSRRYMRAFERMSGPRASSSRALALALVMLVFASGFLLGRVGSLTPTTPTVRALPAAKPIPFDDPEGVQGSISYITMSRDPLATIAMHDVFSGDVTPRARFSPPVGADEYVRTAVASFGRSVAVIVASDGEGFVAIAPHNRPPHGWVPGLEVAWQSERDLLVRHVDGSVARWTFGSDSVRSSPEEDADELIQTSVGAVVRRGRVLKSVASPKRKIVLPRGAEAVAVAPDMSRVLLDARVPTLWDGEQKVAMRTGSGRTLGASFDRAGERVAVVLRSPDGLQLAIVDAKGNAQIKPLDGGDGCEGVPVWDAAGRWVYVADAEGVVHAVEAGGGRIASVRTGGVGCGVAWVDIT
jgi:hypothetical protein